MKRFFLISILALAAVSAWADGITDGVYFLKNQSGQYLNRGQEWGTRAIVAENGLAVYVTTNAAGFSTLQFIDTGKYLFQDETVYWNCYTDEPDGGKGKCLWKFNSLPDGTYSLSNSQQQSKFLKQDDGDDRLYTDGTDESKRVNWTLVPYADVAQTWGLDLQYKVGDVNRNNIVNIHDLTHEVKALLGEESRTNRHYVDDNDGVTPTDAKELSNIIQGSVVRPDVDSTWTYAMATRNFYPLQNGTAPTTKAVCLLNGTDVSSHYDLSETTTVNISTSISNIAGVSIFSIDKAKIASSVVQFTEGGSPIKTNVPGSLTSVYANGMASDVVTVTQSSNGTYTAYLNPVELPSGVIVTIRTNDGKYYQQTFSQITAGGENNLSFTSTTETHNWMATLPGNIFFNQISTPGSHDAATSGVTKYPNWSKCQGLTVKEQLAAGVRMFDLRPGYWYNSTINESNLNIYHSISDANILYATVFKDMVDFLKDNPTEAISVIMTKENNKPTITGSWSDRSSEMYTTLRSIHAQYSDYMLPLTSSYYTLADYRGKICYVHRNQVDITGTVRIYPWIDDGSITDYSAAINGGSCYANVQDAYNASVSNKKTYMATMFGYSSGNTVPGRYHYNYASIAGSATAYVSSKCSEMNPYATSYITNNVSGPAGYVLADYIGSSSYSGADLLKAIIAQNYKYVYSNQGEQ